MIFDPFCNLLGGRWGKEGQYDRSQGKRSKKIEKEEKVCCEQTFAVLLAQFVTKKEGWREKRLERHF